MKTKITAFLLLLLISVSCKKDKNGPDINKGLISYFNFDDNIKDQQGYSGDGMPTGSLTYGAGRIGKAIMFDGNNQSVVFNATPSQAPINVSISFWMKGTASPNQYLLGILSYEDNFQKYLSFWVDDQNKFYSYLSIQASPIEADFIPENWIHVVGTYDGLKSNLYINGTLTGTLAEEGGVMTSFKKITLGYSEASAKYWTGSIDELYIYNRALTQAEVTQLYNLK